MGLFFILCHTSLYRVYRLNHTYTQSLWVSSYVLQLPSWLFEELVLFPCCFASHIPKTTHPPAFLGYISVGDMTQRRVVNTEVERLSSFLNNQHFVQVLRQFLHIPGILICGFASEKAFTHHCVVGTQTFPI